MFAMFRRNVAHSIEVWTQQLEDLRSLTIGWAILRLMRMVAWRRRKINHRSRATRTRRSTDGMLGCLIFRFSVTSNNLISSFVLPHTPNGHAGLPVLNRPPPLVAAAHAETAAQAATETVAGA